MEIKTQHAEISARFDYEKFIGSFELRRIVYRSTKLLRNRGSRLRLQRHVRRRYAALRNRKKTAKAACVM